ncbi:hypothetical protein M422DRAFT_34359 [Sphaerobolus stellatus SS14]|uniref:Uncharacterized protein n=1 Tax=Sphaerobolus stellatus (strain SS14) TaxID=990650 RepID=A0A0C9VFP2_SPHS4|nr:hypothetical protein M422DRAFT_34359 [Sphaerobolus stellatus SS14]
MEYGVLQPGTADKVGMMSSIVDTVSSKPGPSVGHRILTQLNPHPTIPPSSRQCQPAIPQIA